VRLFPTDHLQAPELSVGNELLADHFNEIPSQVSFAILVTMFRLYNVTGSVKIWIIGIEVKPEIFLQWIIC